MRFDLKSQAGYTLYELIAIPILLIVAIATIAILKALITYIF